MASWIEITSVGEFPIHTIPPGWESGYCAALNLACYDGLEWTPVGKPGWVIGHEPGKRYAIPWQEIQAVERPEWTYRE